MFVSFSRFALLESICSSKAIAQNARNEGRDKDMVHIGF